MPEAKRISKKKPTAYSGELIRYICPGLYGKPIYDTKGNFIHYTITVPKLSSISKEEV